MPRKVLVCFVLIILLTGCGVNKVITEKENINEEVDLIYNMSVKLTNGQNLGKVELYFDGNIKLRLNESEAVVLENININDINELKKQYSLFEIENGIIAVVNKGHTARRSYMILDLFIYKENRIYKIYSSKDILAKIQNINDDEGTIDLNISKYDVVCTMNFTDEELTNWKEKKSQLEGNDIMVDSSYYKDIQDNIIFDPVDYFIENIGEHGDKELLVLVDVYSVGTKSPTIRDRAIIRFDISTEEIGYKDIIFERDSINSEFLFAYFS